MTPINRITRRAYTGSNAVTLNTDMIVNNRSSNEYATMRQWNSEGYKVIAGSKAIKLKFFKSDIVDGQAQDKWVYFNVFNRGQVELSDYTSQVSHECNDIHCEICI